MSFPRSVDRTLDILQAVARKGPATVAELQSDTGLPRSSLYRLLLGLRERQLILLDAGGWARLGPGVLGWADSYRRQNPLAMLALGIMRDLTLATNETSLLTVADFPWGQCVQKVEPERAVRISYAIGSPRPLHAGASSKVLLAFMDAGLLDLYFRTVTLEQYTPTTPTEEATIRQQIAQTQRRGYCYTESELDTGAAAVAVPIFSQGGTLVAGLSVAGPIGRLDVEPALAALRQARDRLETTLRPG